MNILSIYITRQVVMVKHGIVLRQKKPQKQILGKTNIYNRELILHW